MFCRQCGTELEEGVKFCTNCGTPVAQAERQGTLGARGTKEHGYTDSEPSTSAENPNAQSSGANSTKRKGNRGNIWLIVGAILASLIIGTLWGIISDGAKGGVKNKTEDIFILPGLTLVGDPTWEVDSTSIKIKGKVKAETWIGKSVAVQATFYDKDGAIVTVRHDSISDMQAGDMWRFEISLYRDKDISYFIIDSIYY